MWRADKGRKEGSQINPSSRDGGRDDHGWYVRDVCTRRYVPFTMHRGGRHTWEGSDMEQAPGR